MIARFSQWQHERQQGVAIVELAIALPAMMVLLLLTAEFTRVFYQYNTLNKSVRDGSRFLAEIVLDGTSQLDLSSDAVAKVKNLVVYGAPAGGTPLLSGLSTDDVTVSVNQIGNSGNKRHYVEVSAEYTYAPIVASVNGLGFLSSNTQFNFSLNALSSMRAQ